MSNAPTITAPATPTALPARLALALSDIKLSHSVFALPFALLAAFATRPESMPWSRFALLLVPVLFCMVLGRTWAMLVNRLLDRGLDAHNPRTHRRAFAAGSLSPAFGWSLALGCAAGFVVACSGFWFLIANPWPLYLALPVLGWIALYSLTKRFTWACHLFLGTSLAASPLAAAIAIDPRALGLAAQVDSLGPIAPGLTSFLLCLAGMVTLWVAGFDIVYALQDVAVDKRLGLFSVPSRLGVTLALWISRALHTGAAVLLLLAWRSDGRLHLLFGIATAIAIALLIGEHLVLARRGERGLDAAFFTFNGIVSLVVGALGIADLVL
ncbi:MAG TPA: 4-hydroxybenzoate octaprenyltransferase [Phycisphaerales bacterium]